jgi:hypothetical protein
MTTITHLVACALLIVFAWGCGFHAGRRHEIEAGKTLFDRLSE